MLLLKFIPTIIVCCKRCLLFSGLGLVLFVRSFVHSFIFLSEFCRQAWRNTTEYLSSLLFSV